MLQTHVWVFLYFCSSLLMSLMSLTFFRCCLRSGFFNFAWHWTTFPSEAAAGYFCPAKVQLKWTKPFSSMDPEAEMEKVILNWTVTQSQSLCCEMLSVVLQWYFKKLAILLQFDTWNIIFLPLEITEQQDLSFHSMFYLGDKILIFDCCLQDKTLSERRRECKRFWEIWQTCFTNFIPAQIRYLIHARISKSGLGWHHLEIKKIDKKL